MTAQASAVRSLVVSVTPIIAPSSLTHPEWRVRALSQEAWSNRHGMNATRLKVIAVAVVLLSLAVVILWQQRRVERLVAESHVLRERIERARTLQEENQRLADKIALASERARADASELLRLRGQVARARQVEQESRQRAQLIRPATPPPSTVPNDQTPEWKLVQVRMRFSKVLGLSILTFANDNNGAMPADLMAAISSQSEKDFNETLADQLPPEAADHEIRLEQFELVFQGNLKSTGQEPGTTIIARARDPVQLSNGRWARPAVFDDGHAEVFVANTLEELAAQEQKRMHTPTTP